MKLAIFVCLIIPICALMVGTTPTTHEKDRSLEISEVLINVPEVEKDLPGPPVKHPVVIQISHQGFPFDLNGNFPYVVIIDNQVYRYDRREVTNFLEKAVNPHEVNNMRVPGTN